MSCSWSEVQFDNQILTKMDVTNWQRILYGAHKIRREMQENSERKLDEEIANRGMNRIKEYASIAVAGVMVVALASFIAYQTMEYIRINSERQLEQELAGIQKQREDEMQAELECRTNDALYEAHTNGSGGIDCTVSQ